MSFAIEGGHLRLSELGCGSNGASRRDLYQQFGCCRIEEPMLPAALLERARAAAVALEHGEYAPGKAPWRVLRGRHPGSLIKIDQPHWCDPALSELIRHPALGALAAEVTGAKHVQAWATQLLIKPPSGGTRGCVGWHTDQQYWPWFRGGVFTIWVALEDVLTQSGPVRLLAGSHRWPDGQFTGDALGQDLDAQERAWQAQLSSTDRAKISRVDLTLPAGGVAVFEGNLLHCSGPNTSRNTRRGIAIHLCSELAERVLELDDYGFVKRLRDRDQCPVIFGAQLSASSLRPRKEAFR